VRLFTRIVERWHAYTRRKENNIDNTTIRINVFLKVDNSRLQSLLRRKKWFEKVSCLDESVVEISNKKSEVGIHELCKVVKVLKEHEEQRLFRCYELLIEWLILLVL